MSKKNSVTLLNLGASNWSKPNNWQALQQHRILNIEIKNLSKTYPGGFKALDSVDLTITNGMFGLLGPNGAGKSTLIRILVTLMQPTSGQVLVDGKDISGYRKEIRQMVGYLPQDFRFFAKLKSWEFLDAA